MKGFTLIELLVVVLIIGILAAVALPQYQKAVDKTNMVEVFNTFQQIRQAMIIYHLAQNEWPNDLNLLDIDIPANSNWRYELINSTTNESATWPNPNWIRGWASIRAIPLKNGTGGAVFYSIPEREKINGMRAGIFCCLNFASNNKEKFKKFCQASAKAGADSPGGCYQGEYVPVRLVE